MEERKESNQLVGEVNSTMMSKSKTLERISAYIAKNKLKAALEAEVKYISADIIPELKIKVIQLLKEYKYCFVWYYNEIPGLNRDLVELKLPIKPRKKPIKQTPRRFAPEVLSKIKE